MGQSPVRLDKDPAKLPRRSQARHPAGEDAAAWPRSTTESHKVLRDPEGNVIPRTLDGSVYLAKPFDNPFDSLLAIYLVIEDPRSGTIAKLAGQGRTRSR